ncbi:LruC domain-containing protein [Marinobacter sp. AL4B]|uniref:LruC domain-containing protein n=1 Tax=Marinobacter sp. AL4B TaxID=2871173 RepID=UPI001CAA6D70|nr:LruC domain-containing protein [Marinobacter sp. AL4B]MBZ0333434.1 LruC domain-containing protein [Marinobacter sp. AL4B]
MKKHSMLKSSGLKYILPCLLLPSLAHSELASFRFKDNIRSDGVGTINLFTPGDRGKKSNGALLEAFRNDNGGNLVFAVDISEPSSGSETPTSQGVALEYVTLKLTFPEEVVSYNSYITPTYSFLKRAGSDVPALYGTMIGDANSNRVSSNANSELNGSSWDSVLRIPIDRSLEDLVSAELEVGFLPVDKKAGDPEGFYDFGGRGEIIALLTANDATSLDELVPGRAFAPLVLDESGATLTTWTYLPSSTGYYIASYEDLYPNRGDYDFNDLVVAYQVALGSEGDGVKHIRGNGHLIARGAAYDHDWHLRIELPEWAVGHGKTLFFEPGSEAPLAGYPKDIAVLGSANLLLAEHVADQFMDGTSTYVNTFEEQTVQQGPRFEFSLTLDVPVPADEIAPAPFDPFIYVHETGYEIHLAGKNPVLGHSRNRLDGIGSFRDQSNFPFAMIIPDDFEPPLAAIDIGLAYPSFVEYVESEGASQKDWYQRGVANKVKKIPFKSW